MTRRLVLGLAMMAFALTSMVSECGSENTPPVATPTDNPPPVIVRTDNPPNVDASLVGKWKLVASTGGISGGG